MNVLLYIELIVMNVRYSISFIKNGELQPKKTERYHKFGTGFFGFFWFFSVFFLVFPFWPILTGLTGSC